MEQIGGNYIIKELLKEIKSKYNVLIANMKY